MDNRNYIVALDSSNYKTSVAVVRRDGSIKKDIRQLLRVEKGEKGLRQSDAVFQHMGNLPRMIREVFDDIHGGEVAAIVSSNKPRQMKDSYMPCFLAGEAFGSALASGLGVPFFTFSHQEGHLAAIKETGSLKNARRYLAMHLSGGTTEILKVDESIEIIGGSRDISFGQVLDRAGVLLGLDFPCGDEMDLIALKAEKTTAYLKSISRDGNYINLSGIDTQLKRLIETQKNHDGFPEEFYTGIIREIFDKIAECLIDLVKASTKSERINCIILAGGVSSSEYIAAKIRDAFSGTDIVVDFGRRELASDNAAGLGYLGRNIIWPENR